MTELHATNLRRGFADASAAFDRAKEAGDWGAARKALVGLAASAHRAVDAGRDARTEAESLAVELQLYRPTRSDLVPAPLLPDHDYVTTIGGGPGWICAAKVVHERVWINAGHGYWQDHYTTERVTACGRKVGWPVKDRFGSGGWPRLHEVCPDCTRKLAAAEPALFTQAATTPDPA